MAQRDDAVSTPGSVAAGFADPGPLGLAGFAGTTFYLSAVNAGLLPKSVEAGVFGLAIFYGGIAQLLAGMWEFVKGNTFGAVAFSSFGAFWLSFWYLVTHLPKAPASDIGHAVGTYLLIWTIFTAYMFVASMRTSGAIMAVFLFLTLYMQLFLQYEPLHAGLAFLPFSVGVIVGAGIGSQLVVRVGPRVVVPAGLLLGTAGLLWLSTLDVESTYTGTLLPAMLVMSLGMGFIFMAVTNVALVGISKDDAGVASAMVNTTQQIGGSLGTAVLTTFSTSAAAAFLVANLPADAGADVVRSTSAAAAVHGWSVAFFWAAMFFATATVASLWLIRAGKIESTPASEVAVHVG